MAKLYIANLTRQHHHFIYRVPESGRMQTQRIEVGKQILVFGEAAPEVLSAIIAQHEVYGIIAVSAIDQSRGRFTGICYQYNKPIDVAKIERGIAQNTDVLAAQGVEMRRTAALAGFDGAEGRPAVGRVEIEEVTPETGATKLHETILVHQDGHEPPPVDGRPIDAPRMETARRGGRRKAA